MDVKPQYIACHDLPVAQPLPATLQDSSQATFDFLAAVESYPAQANPGASEVLRQYGENYYRALVELEGDGVMVATRDGVIIDTNEAMCDMLGLARTQIIGRPVSELPVTPESLEKSPWRFDWLSQGKVSVAERALMRPDASNVMVEMRMRMLSDGTLYLISRNITERKREEKALRESEDRYRQLFELESDAIFLIDNEVGQIVEVNAAATALYGFSREELMSMRNVDLSAQPEATQRKTAGSHQQKGSIIYIPLRYHRKADGTVFPVEITARSFMQGGRAVHVAAIRDITERKRAEDELREREERLRELAETLEVRVLNRTRELESSNLSLAHSVAQLRRMAMELTQAEDRERKRLALQLHDHLQPFLVAASMKVSLLSLPLPAAEQSQSVREVLDLITSALNASRSLTRELYPPILLDAGIMPGLRWLADWIKDKYGVTVELGGEDSLEIPDAMGIFVFQVIRELLFNVAKHAKSNMAMVTLTMKDSQRLHIMVSDQGVGFPEPFSGFTNTSCGFGLFHIHERLAAMGGMLDVVSTSGQGAKVFVSLPMMPDQLALAFET